MSPSHSVVAQDAPRSPPPPAAMARHVRALQHELSHVPDEQILKVLAVIDSLEERGDADTLLNPLRARLGLLQPGRPLRFARVLFSPIDRIVVEARDWKRDPMRIPRSALSALGAQVHRGVGPLAGRIDAMLVGKSTRDTDLLRDAGALLWPAAAEYLRDAMPGAFWDETGLAVQDFTTLAGTLAGVLALAPSLESLCAAHEVGEIVDDGRIEALLDAAGEKGERIWRMVLVLVLERLSGHPGLPRLVRSAERNQGSGGRAAIERSVENVLQRLESRHQAISRSPGHAHVTMLTGAVMEVRRVCDLLDRIVEMNLGTAQQKRTAVLRHQLDQTCRERFSEAMRGDFLPALEAAAAHSGQATDAQLAAMEGDARTLRAFEMAARRLGGGADYDRLLRAAADRVRGLRNGGALAVMDRARMLEILAGPEAGLKLLLEAS